MIRYIIGVAGVIAAVWACSGDVEVHGIPETIELQAPFCVPPTKDAGTE